MSNKIVPEIYDFERECAFELLKLVEEAHKRYDDVSSRSEKTGKMFDHTTPATKKWLKGGWESDFTPIKINSTIKIDKKCNGDRHPEIQEIEEYREITSYPYQVLAYLIFSQTVWSVTDIKNKFKRKNLIGFIVKHSKTNDLYVVFRGTSNIGEWISNVKFIQQSYTTVKSYNSEGETHWGFRRTYDRPESYDPDGRVLWATHWFDQILLKDVSSIREIVETTLKNHCSPQTEKVKIYVTGHSLGGALATLATAHIKQLIDKGEISAYDPILYSFASPRVGDIEFAKTFDKLECCYRVANSEDLVPKIPLPTLLPMSGRLPARSGILQGMTTLFNEKLDFQHAGMPIYFTLQKGNISDNHTLPVYFEALLPQNYFQS